MDQIFTHPDVQKLTAQYLREKRVTFGFTQQGLAKRADVNVRALRMFEQKGKISFESFAKLACVLGVASEMVKSLESKRPQFRSFKEFDKHNKRKVRKNGFRE